MKKLILILLFPLSCFAQFETTTSVTNLAALKRLSVTGPYKIVDVRGKTNAGDGWQGTFVYNSSSTLSADDSMAVQPNIGICCWERQTTGRDYFGRWFDTVKTNATVQSAINWVSTHGGGNVILDGGVWWAKSDDNSRITLKSNVQLITTADSQIQCAPFPTTNWIVVDFALNATNCGVGPAKIIGWNLVAPGGNTNNTGVIFSIQNTKDVTIGGVNADNWYTKYAVIANNNERLKMLDVNWKETVQALGAKGDGRDDTVNIQEAVYYAENYNKRVFFNWTADGYLTSGSWITNGVGIELVGEGTVIKNFYYNPTEGVLPHPSGAFIISSPNCFIHNLSFQTTGSYPITETNQIVTGFFVPVQIHNGTNNYIKDCSFDVESGKGSSTSGSYTTYENCFFRRCGLSTGLGSINDWLFYEAPVPDRGQGFSPRHVKVINCIFSQGTPYKHTLFFSSADDLLCEGNKLIDMNTQNPLLIYTGDLGVTDELGTNIYKFSGKVVNNTITGTNFGANAAITLRLNTTTNYVPASFIPSNMFSAFIIENNHVEQTGTNGNYNGIELIAGNGTKILNNDIRVKGLPLWLTGDCDNIVVQNNYFEDGPGNTFGGMYLSEGFEAPPSFKSMTIRNNTFLVSASNEYWFRNVEPIATRDLNLLNNWVYYYGAAGTGGPPAVLQLTACEGYLNMIENKFFITNSLNGRRLGTIIGTNNFVLRLIGNESYVVPGGFAYRRGFSVNKADVVMSANNDIGTHEYTDIRDLQIRGNYIKGYTNAEFALDIRTTDRAMILGNVITNDSTVAAVAVNIDATNSIFAENIVSGNSSSDLVRGVSGKMYINNNIIRNSNGGGSVFPTVNSPGTLSHDIYEHVLHVRTPLTDTGFVGQFSRVGTGMNYAFHLDNDLTYFYSWPSVTNSFGGYQWLVHNNNTPTNTYTYGMTLTGDQRLILGDPTNSSHVFVIGHSNTTFARIMTTTTTGTVDAGVDIYVPSGGFVDTPSGSVYFSSGDLSGIEQRFSRIYTTANDAGFDKRGRLIFQVADNSGTLQTVASGDYQQNFVVTSRIILGTGAQLISGTGNPESVVAAPVGSIFTRTDGTGGAYGKTNGTSTTGWGIIGAGGGGAGDVVGPGAATDNQVALFSGSSGKLLKATSLWFDNGVSLAPNTTTSSLGSSANPVGSVFTLTGIDIGTNHQTIQWVLGSPQGIQVETSGSLRLRTDGTDDTSLYVKVSDDTKTTNWAGIPTLVYIPIVCSDETTALTTGTSKRTVRMLGAGTLVGIRASLVTAQTSGSIFTVDFNKNGTTCLSTKLTIDNTEKTSTTAATPAVISVTSFADDDEISVDIDQVGDGTAAGLKVVPIFRR